MPKKQKRNRSRNPDPDRVLRGTANVGAHELIDLIHRINPTGLGLSGSETLERYRQKRSLQSQLIARFRNDLQVRADPARPDVITLLYRGRDACHTLLSELDPEVRAWAQGYLDRRWVEQRNVEDQPPAARAPTRPAPETGLDVPEPLPAQPAAEDLEQLLQLARQALDEYDLETARHLWRVAADSHPQSLDAARGYLDLLVETLGDNQSALAFGQGLARTLAGKREVRELLGLAAARQGDAELAESYLRHLRGPRAGEAYRALCAHAIGLRDPLRAQHFLERAREKDGAAEYELQALSNQIAGLRQEMRQPLEQQLEQLFAAGDLDQAQRQAEACLIRWPDSQAARALLARIEEVRRREQARSCLREAKAAIERQDFPDALVKFQEALALGSSPDTLWEGFSLAQRQVEQERERAELERLRDLMERPDPAEGLLAYLQAPPPLRERLRNELAAPMLEWLEVLGSPHSGARQRNMVQAVVALQEAMGALAQGSPDQAAALLSPYWRQLQGLDQARRVWGEVEAHQTEARRQAALGALAETRQALQQGRLDDAAGHLEKLERQILTEQQRQEADQMLQRLRHSEQRLLLEQRLGHLRGQGDLLRERALLDQLIALAAPQDRPGLRDRRRRLSLRIERQWLPRIELAPEAAHVLLQLDMDRDRSQTALSLFAERDEMLVAFPVQSGLFACRLDVRRLDCIDHRLIMTPEPWRRPIDIAVEGRFARLTDYQGLVLELTLEPWEVVCYRRLMEHLPTDQRLERPLAHPGDRFCWLEGSTELGTSSLRIIDLEQGRERRALPSRAAFPLLVLGSPAWMLLEDQSTGVVSAYTTGGKRLVDFPALTFHVTHAAACLADGSLITLSYEPNGEDDNPLVASVHDRRGHLLSQREIPDTHGELWCALAVMGEPPLAFVLHRHPEKQARLVCLAPLPEGLQPVYSLPVDERSALLQDARGSKAAIVSYPADHPPQLHMLGEEPPSLAVGADVNLAALVPEFHPPWYCGLGGIQVPHGEAILPQAIHSGPDPEVLDWARDRVQALLQNPRELTGFVTGLLDADRHAVVERLGEWALEDGQDRLLLMCISVFYDRGCWDRVQRLVGPLCSAQATANSGADHAQHLYHLLGMALWQKGRLSEALDVWQRGAELPGRCRLEPYIDLASYFLPSSPAESGSAYRPVIHDLMSRLQEADRHFQSADYREAIRALDHPLIWMLKETQSLARLSFALLQWEQSGPQHDFLRLTACSCFLEAQADKPGLLAPPEIRFPGAWSQSRIERHRRETETWIARLRERAQKSPSQTE